MGIDWVSVVVLVGAYAFAQVRSVPAAVRYGVFAAAAGIIALYKLSSSRSSVNMVLVLVAAVLAVWYTVKAIQAMGTLRRPRR